MRRAGRPPRWAPGGRARPAEGDRTEEARGRRSACRRQGRERGCAPRARARGEAGQRRSRPSSGSAARHCSASPSACSTMTRSNANTPRAARNRAANEDSSPAASSNASSKARLPTAGAGARSPGAAVRSSERSKSIMHDHGRVAARGPRRRANDWLWIAPDPRPDADARGILARFKRNDRPRDHSRDNLQANPLEISFDVRPARRNSG